MKCHWMTVFGGAFTLLWHNSHLTTAQDRAFYQALVV